PSRPISQSTRASPSGRPRERYRSFKAPTRSVTSRLKLRTWATTSGASTSLILVREARRATMGGRESPRRARPRPPAVRRPDRRRRVDRERRARLPLADRAVGAVRPARVRLDRPVPPRSREGVALLRAAFLDPDRGPTERRAPRLGAARAGRARPR